MRSQQITHLHVHFATPAAMVGLLVKSVFGYTFSFTVHGPDEFYDAAGYNLTEKILAADFVFSFKLSFSRFDSETIVFKLFSIVISFVEFIISILSSSLLKVFNLY